MTATRGIHVLNRTEFAQYFRIGFSVVATFYLILLVHAFLRATGRRCCYFPSDYVITSSSAARRYHDLAL